MELISLTMAAFTLGDKVQGSGILHAGSLKWLTYLPTLINESAIVSVIHESKCLLRKMPHQNSLMWY